ncbi:hypothetical protein QYM36_010397 [Artemia franciscana]|uniref:Pyridoxal kinase n=2 Tax=Artemia franciscana TaxID=6661 RepID=A0AA88LC02_ARTSF|nr:hypothetical protein QYM36_010397 [Artemia franciscana]
MPAPQNQEELQTLLGIDLSKQQKFEWNTSHEEAKRGIQNAISKNLSYFDPEAKEIEVITDASQHGQLSTDRATVTFASLSLSETEQRYSQMEKEMLAITFACKRFHQYLFRRTICVTTDHKPLESIFGKSIQRAPPRLQRMMLAIQPYDIKLRYKPGKTIPVADTLSRLHLADTDIESQHGRNMEPLKMGQKVWVQLTDQGTWKKATVCKAGDSPRSYYVRLEEGGTFCRNRIHIKSRQDPMVTDLHVCDPVLGDNGKMYVPKELVPIYAKEVVKVADILTPNQYEAELLTGMKIASEEDAVRVIDHFHKEGVKIVVLSSTDLGSDDELISFASIATDGKHEMYRITIPCIRDTFTGTGDLFAALFLAWTSKTDNNVKVSLEKTQASLQAVLKRTMEHAKSVAPSGAKLYPRYLELRLVQSMDIFLSPPEMCKASRIR